MADHQPQVVTQVLTSPVPVPGTPAWYRDIPQWARAGLQLGFAGLIALLFAVDSRDRNHQAQAWQEDSRDRMHQVQAQVQAWQEDSRQQAREDRQMFRDELRSQRDELRSAVVEMKRAVDRLDDSQRTIKQDVRDLKFGGPEAFRAPPPREK